MQIELKAWNGPVFIKQEDGIEVSAGRTPKTIIEFAEDLVGTSPADTDEAIEDLVTAKYKLYIGPEGSTMY